MVVPNSVRIVRNRVLPSAYNDSPVRHLFLLALAIPVSAQLRDVKINFAGIGCAPCIESLPSRLQRIRGVESATVDAQAGTVILHLAIQNRVRIEQLRDAIEQDGTKTTTATITAHGTLIQEEGKWRLSPLTIPLESTPELKPGPARLDAVISNLHQPVLHATRIILEE